MAKPKLSQREIVQRLQMIEALAADGVPVAEAIRSAGMPQADYDRWRLEYNGLGRTLGPLSCATPKLLKTNKMTVSLLRVRHRETLTRIKCG